MCFGRIEIKMGDRNSRSYVIQTRTPIEKKYIQTAFGSHKRIKRAGDTNAYGKNPTLRIFILD